MKLKKKKKIIHTVQELIAEPVCSTNQDKPECSLVQELREIQEKLSERNDLYNERKKIMLELLGNKYSYSYDYNFHCRPNIDSELILLTKQGINFTNTKSLEYIIGLLQDYKVLTEKSNNQEKLRKTLQQREKEIKMQLGIK